MARIKYSGLIDNIRGSIGGTTFQNNKYGYTIKRKPNMTKPHSCRQNINKSLFNRAVKAWREATQTTRDNWDTWASTNPQYAKHNPTAQLSGFACFVKWTFYSFQRSGQVTVDPEIDIPPIATVAYSLENDSGTFSVISDWDIETEAWYSALFLSRPLLPSQSFIGTKPKYIATDSSADQKNDITAAYTSIYGSIPTVGSLIGITYVMFMEDGGAVLAPQQVIVEVVAP